MSGSGRFATAVMKTMLCVAVLTAICTVTTTWSADDAPHPLAKLPSGKQIKILSIGPVVFGDGSRGLTLNYETAIAIDNVAALAEEADEIWWAAFQRKVEGAGLRVAIISANEKPKGLFLKQNRGYNFVFQRSADGQWSRNGPKSH